MDFSLDPDQLTYRNAVIKFAQNELNNDVINRDRASEFDAAAFRKCAEFGIQVLPMPAEYGGSGADSITVVVGREGLAYGCKDNGLLFSLNAQMWSFEVPLLEFGTEEQKQRYLPRLCRGEIIGVHAMTEPEAGSDAFSLRARFEKRDGGYVLNGTKMFITNAPISDVILVFATEDRCQGIQGISACIVEKGTPGFTVSRHLEKMGLRTSPMGEVVLDDCRIPEENRVGPEGVGVAICNCSMELQRGSILANYLR